MELDVLSKMILTVEQKPSLVCHLYEKYFDGEAKNLNKFNLNNGFMLKSRQWWRITAERN